MNPEGYPELDDSYAPPPPMHTQHAQHAHAHHAYAHALQFPSILPELHMSARYLSSVLVILPELHMSAVQTNHNHDTLSHLLYVWNIPTGVSLLGSRYASQAFDFRPGDQLDAAAGRLAFTARSAAIALNGGVGSLGR